MKKIIKKLFRSLIPSNIELMIRYYLPCHRVDMEEINNNEKKVFIFLAADYGNLGDIAITEAQRNFIMRALPNHKVILVKSSVQISTYRYIKKYITTSDIVTIIGGGNMGDMYSSIEDRRNLIINLFNNNKIISFPQTIDFSDSVQGNQKLSELRSTVQKHKKIFIFAREIKSFNKMKDYFGEEKTFIAPDIVISTKSIFKNNLLLENRKIISCLRNDNERSIEDSLNIEQRINNFAKKNNYEYEKSDTHIGNDNLSYEELKTEYDSFLKNISNANLVITDRLHGMIFCFITRTPCLFFDNSNKKVSGVFRWIDDCSFIKMTNNEDLENHIKSYLFNNSLNNDYDDSKLIKEFSNLELLLKRCANDE